MKTHILKLLLASWAITTALPAMAKPNLIVIFIDDMGYGDIGPFGSTKNDTPHLDRMAKEGMKLTSFYLASSVCTPSRAALMTGSYPRRVGLGKGSGHVVLFPGDPHGLHPKEITIAEMLKGAGYATGCFGKWHLGDQPEFLPTSQGFDEYVGIPYSNDMWTGLKRWKFPHLPILRGTKVIDQVKDMEGQADLCRLFTVEAVKFIENNKDKPFFCYVPHAFVHNPRKARPEFMAKAKTIEEAQVEECDWSAGQILDAVRKAGIEKDTFVLFTSDNGGAGGLSSGPLRGGKGSMWEGGFRGPTVAWWPGTIPAGSTCKEMTSAMDLLPTFAKWAGGKVPADRVIDGKVASDLYLGKEGAKTPHDRFFYNASNNLRAVRSGPWKLFLKGPLHNLEENLGETKNYASERPGVVKRLRGYAAEFEKDLKKNSRPVGVAKNPRTLVPRPGAEGEDAYTPTLWIGKTK